MNARLSSLSELEIPQQDVRLVVASSDLNVSKYITTVIMVFMRNGSSVVIWRKFKKCSINANVPPEEYDRQLYNLLSEHGMELKNLGIRIDAWAIDGNGTAWNAVTRFANNSKTICGISAASFVGRASHQYRDYLRSRLKESVNRTLLCGDDDEQKKFGSGTRWTYFDSDLYHEKCQKGFLQSVGNLGSISWYKGADHSKFSIQVCAEKLVDKVQRADGTVEYKWKQIGTDHDVLDAIGQALAVYGSFGFSDNTIGKTSTIQRKGIKRFPRKKYVFT